MKTNLTVLFLGSLGVAGMTAIVWLYPNTNKVVQVAYADTRAVRHYPDFNRITRENEWYAAFASQEIYGSQVTQKHGRVFATGEEASEAEINEVLERIAE